MTANDATVTVTLVTYNSADVIAACLESLPAGMDGIDRYEVVVADNASSDGTVAEVERTAPQVKVLELAENQGYAAAINAVTATVSGGAVLVLNPDVRLHPGSVRHLLRALDRPGVGIAVPRIVDAHGHLDPSLRHDTDRGPDSSARPFSAARTRAGTSGGVKSTPGRAGTSARGKSTGPAAPRCSCPPSASPRSDRGTSRSSCTPRRSTSPSGTRLRLPGVVHAGRGRHPPTHGEGSTSPALRPLMMRNRLALYRRRHGARQRDGGEAGSAAQRRSAPPGARPIERRSKRCWLPGRPSSRCAEEATHPPTCALPASTGGTTAAPTTTSS